MKKTLALLLSIMLVLSLTSSFAETRKVSDEKVTLNVATLVNDGEPASKDVLFWNYFEDITNTHVEFEDFLVSAWADKKNVIMASGEMPKAFLGHVQFTDDDLVNFGQNGIILPIQDYITPEIMPNFSKYMAEHPEWKAAITAGDGNIYSVPRIFTVGAGSFYIPDVPYINQEWMEKLGFGDLSFDESWTLEQFEEILTAFKEKDPNGNGLQDEIPWSFANGGKNAMLWANSFGIVLDRVTNLYVDNNVVKFGPTQEGYKAFVTWLNGLYQKGLIDVESFTQSNQVFNAKCKNDPRIIGVCSGWRDNLWSYNDDDHSYRAIMPLNSGIADPAIYADPEFILMRCGFTLTSTCDNPELYLKWADNMLDPSISLSINTNQYPGEHIQYNEDGTYTQLRLLDWSKEGERSFMPGNVSRLDILTKDTFDKQDKFAPVVIQKNPLDEKYMPVISKTITRLPGSLWLSSEDAQEVDIYRTDIDAYVLDSFARWITEGGIDAEWDQYVKQLEQMGANRMVEIYQGYIK